MNGLSSVSRISLKQIPVKVDSLVAKRNMEVRELSRLATNENFAKNLAYADLICNKVREFIPKGTNTDTDSIKHPELTIDDKKRLIILIRLEIDYINKKLAEKNGGNLSTIEVFHTCAEVLKKYGYAHCGELSRTGFIEAWKNPDISFLHLCESSQGKHSFFVIGSRENDVWGDDAVVCDPWAEECYSVAEFYEMQKPENEVKYAKEFYMPEIYIEAFPDHLPPRPYLAGDINVIYSWNRTGL